MAKLFELVTILVVVVLHHEVLGSLESWPIPQPSGVTEQRTEESTPGSGRTFGSFDVEDLNPFNWISGRKTTPPPPDAKTKISNKTNLRFEVLFRIVECLASNTKENDCGKLVNEARLLFENAKLTNNTTTTSKFDGAVNQTTPAPSAAVQNQ